MIYRGSTLGSYPDTPGRLQFIIDFSIPRRESHYWDWFAKSLLVFEEWSSKSLPFVRVYVFTVVSLALLCSAPTSSKGKRHSLFTVVSASKGQ